MATTNDTADPVGAAGAVDDTLGSVIGHRPFRRLLTANILNAIGFGGSRFVFVWLVGDLTEWNPATAILGIVIGLPPLLLSAWAGALADRMSPRRLAELLFALSAAVFAVTGVLVVVDAMTVALAIGCGFVATIGPSMLMPLMQALIPTVTPPRALMQAIALQNLGMMVAVMTGIFLGGAIMQVAGTAAGFWLLTAASVAGWLLARSGALPDQLAGARTADRGSVRDAARVALGTEPLRSLLALTAIFGIAITASTLLLPEFARDVLGRDSLAASALNVAMSVGMMITVIIIATRWRPTRPGLVLTIFVSLFLGGGLIAIGSTRTYLLTALCCLAWGAAGGVAMTLMRTLTQSNTPPELMGRVMGLTMLAQNGAFPVAAGILFGLVSFAGVADAMVIVGALCTALTWIVAARPHVRRLTSTEAMAAADG